MTRLGRIVVVLAIAGLLALGAILHKRPAQAVDLNAQKQADLQAYETEQRKNAVAVPDRKPGPMAKPAAPARPEPAPLGQNSGVRIADQISSRWFIDYVPDRGGTVWNAVYVFAVKPSATTSAAIVIPHKDVVAYSPRPVGEITITAVSGLEGTLDFTTTLGISGTFNMADQTWHF